jgi:RNA polymerase sigma-70 factor (ECF subfamily)
MDYKGDIFYIDQVLNGNMAAFGCILERYKNRAYNLAFRICGNREEAEEAAQDAFLKVFKSLRGFRMKSSFSTWLYRIVYNTAISYSRNRKNEILSLSDFPAEFKDFEIENAGEPESDKEYRNALINFAMKAISEEERGIITMFYYEDMSIENISEATGLSKSNIKVKLFRARQRMLEIIGNAEKKTLINHEQVR